MNTDTALTLPPTTELMRQATDVAHVCKSIVSKTAMSIQGRQYIRSEGWLAIATAHGCIASARDVQRIEGGFRAIGELRRISDGIVLATAEGFVGDDEKMWASRPEYARRAMCSTRAVSRVCRTAFAHVVVLMDAGLETTPADEVPEGGFEDRQPTTRVEKAVTSATVQAPEPRRVAPTAAPQAVTVPRDPAPAGDDSWRSVPIPVFMSKGKNERYAGKTLGDMADRDLQWWAQNYEPKPWKGEISQRDIDLKAALMAGLATLTPGQSAATARKQPSEDELANVSHADAADVEF